MTLTSWPDHSKRTAQLTHNWSIAAQQDSVNCSYAVKEVVKWGRRKQIPQVSKGTIVIMENVNMTCASFLHYKCSKFPQDWRAKWAVEFLIKRAWIFRLLILISSFNYEWAKCVSAMSGKETICGGYTKTMDASLGVQQVAEAVCIINTLRTSVA